MAEHSFQEVMKQWHRMCKSIRSDCRECEIYKKALREHCCFCNKDTFGEDAIKSVEIIVMQWAADHPEPVYPTWAEWLHAEGIVNLGTYCDKAFKPIPADIAQKLGLQPKEGQHGVVWWYLS